jgi:hypothetical protein
MLPEQAVGEVKDGQTGNDPTCTLDGWGPRAGVWGSRAGVVRGWGRQRPALGPKMEQLN